MNQRLLAASLILAGVSTGTLRPVFAQRVPLSRMKGSALSSSRFTLTPLSGLRLGSSFKLSSPVLSPVLPFSVVPAVLRQPGSDSHAAPLQVLELTDRGIKEAQGNGQGADKPLNTLFNGSEEASPDDAVIADAAPAISGRLGRWTKNVKTYLRWKIGPIEKVPFTPSRDENRYYYHGTSWKDILVIVLESNGEMTSGITYLATRHHFSEPYSRGRARKIRSKSIVLEFLEGPVGELSAFATTVIGNYPAYVTHAPLPLKHLSPASKAALLAEAEKEEGPDGEVVRAFRRVLNRRD